LTAEQFPSTLTACSEYMFALFRPMLTKVVFHIDGVLCAAVALALPRSLELLRVAAFSTKEAEQGGADAWGASELHTLKCALWKHMPDAVMGPAVCVPVPLEDLTLAAPSGLRFMLGHELHTGFRPVPMCQPQSRLCHGHASPRVLP